MSAKSSRPREPLNKSPDARRSGLGWAGGFIQRFPRQALIALMISGLSCGFVAPSSAAQQNQGQQTAKSAKPSAGQRQTKTNNTKATKRSPVAPSASVKQPIPAPANISPLATVTPHNSPDFSAIKDPKVASQEREEIRRKLAELRKSIQKTDQDRFAASRAVAALEQMIAETNLQLKQLDAQSKAIAEELRLIQMDEIRLKQNIDRHQRLAARIVKTQYQRSQFNPMQAWVAGHSPAETSRETVWYQKIAAAETEVSNALKSDLHDLAKLKRQKEAKEDQLEANTRAQEKKRREQVAQQEERQLLVAQLSKQLAAQKQEAAKLERDEKRLGSLIEELARALRAARRSAEQQQKSRKPRSPGAPAGRDIDVAIPDTGAFAALRGQLQLPAHGPILGRFGQTRSADGVGPTWKGIFIGASDGSPVKVIASGRVVFAETLRGFGRLIIVDHGDQFLSVYGNNERLLKEAGDLVKANETIATVGNSSGNLDTGLYFEIRHQGQPIDPLKWAGQR